MRRRFRAKKNPYPNKADLICTVQVRTFIWSSGVLMRTRPHPNRSPAKRVRFGKGGSPVNHRAGALARLRSIHRTSDAVVCLRCPYPELRPRPNRSPAQAGPIRKGGSPVNHRAGALARLRSIHRTSDVVVEAGGVEPPSENVSERTSPCADGYCGPEALSPSGWQAVTPCRSGSFMMHGARKA